MADAYFDATDPEVAPPKEEAQPPPRRTIPFRTGSIPPSEFPSNYISTTRYTLLTFLPKNLFEQFAKVANTYFLCIAILSSFDFSPKTPLVSILPLVFVLSVTAIKEGIEDYRRYQSDVEINNTKSWVWRNGSWSMMAWADIRVGDMIKVLDGEGFPADLCLLQSSAQQGICNIETSNLDGETNLKIKQACAATYEIESHDGNDYPNKFKATIESDAPNERMDKNSWKGNLIGLNGSQERTPVTFTQLLLRGCALKNTKWVVGVVVATGIETKLMLQNKGKKMKRSNVDRIVDKALYLIFGLQAVICIFGAVAYSVWLNANVSKTWYLPFVIDNIDIDEEAAVSFFTYLVLVDLLVPISLYVSMELVKAAQAWFISQDARMYHAETDIPARARTSNLNEELGQVSYIFSDKTGTLTQNKMEFLRASVAGVAYGPGEEERAGDHPARINPKKGIPAFTHAFRFADNRLLNNLANNHESAKQIDEFLTLLAVCNTVVPEYPDDSDDVEDMSYQAASPDELALVVAAAELQYFFRNREPVKFNLKGLGEIHGQRVKVNILGEEVYFSVLELLEFNSVRKRMSIIVLDPRDKKIKIYCKGADTVIRERCSKKSLARSWKVTEKHLQDFAVEGLRTLCLGYRVIPKKEFKQWYGLHSKAKASMDNREAEINETSAMIERDLELLGATAIEDRLQDGVPETIANLARAGVKLAVLTGDKLETAINIGRSCHLLTPKMRGKNLLVVDIDEMADDESAKRDTLEAFQHCDDHIRSCTADELENVGLVVSGRALSFVFPIRKLDKQKKEITPPPHVLEEERQLQARFFEIMRQVKAVILCRMSPRQKSQVVTLVRESDDSAITLAIGDGANDVAMIQAAHVGVGIEGLEGKQAVMASDYAIGQFEFLQHLLLKHGAWSYRRLSVLILYSFWKNVTISMLGVWFAFYSGYSAQVFVDAISGALYNIVFTSIPVLLAAIFNRDISAENLIKHPELYRSGLNDEHFNLRLMGTSIAQGFFHSLVLYFFSIYTFESATLSDGTDNDLWVMSTACYTCLVHLVNYKMALQTTTWVWLSPVFLFLSVLSWYLWSIVYSVFQWANPDMYYVFMRLLTMGNFWFLVVLAPIACLVPDLAYEYIRSTWFFTRDDIIKEREQGYGPAYKFDALGEVELVHEDKKDGLIGDSHAARASGGWAKVAQRVKNDHLGFVPFIEDESGDAYVMGQQEFLQRYLRKKNDGVIDIAEGEQGDKGGASAASSTQFEDDAKRDDGDDYYDDDEDEDNYV